MFIPQPWYGLDTKCHHYTSVGPATGRFSMTSKDDIGRSLARLAILAANDPTSVPDRVRLSGDAKSYQELADIFSRENGEEIKVSEESVEEFTANMDKENMDPASFLRYETIDLSLF